jgi:hypothetical protein
MLRGFDGGFLVERAGRDRLVHLLRPFVLLFALDGRGGLLVWGDAFALAELRLARLAFGRLRGLLASTWCVIENGLVKFVGSLDQTGERIGEMALLMGRR